MKNLVKFSEDCWVDSSHIIGIWIDPDGTTGVQVNMGYGQTKTIITCFSDPDIAREHVKEFLEGIVNPFIDIKPIGDNRWVKVGEVASIQIEQDGRVFVHFRLGFFQHFRCSDENAAREVVNKFMETVKRKDE